MITVLNLISAASLAAATLNADPVWVQREAYLMGSVLRVEVRAEDRETGIRATEAVFETVSRLEAMLSSWRPESELSAVNRSAVGRPSRLSDELATLLGEAVRWHHETGGAFDPAIGALIDVLDLRGQGRTPGQLELEAAVVATGFHHFGLDVDGRSVTRLNGKAWLDTGSFGKGAALRESLEVLRGLDVLEARLDFGGQLAVLRPTDGEAWEVGIADPEDRALSAGSVCLREGSVATSGQSERWVEVGGERRGHIVDPRSGRSVDAWGNVAVIADDPMVADIVATAVFVMGPEEGWRWAESRDDIGVILTEITDDGGIGRGNEYSGRYQCKEQERRDIR